MENPSEQRLTQLLNSKGMVFERHSYQNQNSNFATKWAPLDSYIGWFATRLTMVYGRYIKLVHGVNINQ